MTGADGDFVCRGRVEGPAPGDDNPSSSSCRLILLGRTIRFLIDNSLLLASALGLAFVADPSTGLSTGRLVILPPLPFSIVFCKSTVVPLPEM